MQAYRSRKLEQLQKQDTAFQLLESSLSRDAINDLFGSLGYLAPTPFPDLE